MYSGADPGFDRGGGGPQIVTGLKLPFWGLSFVEFWCWGLIFGGQGGGPGPPPGSAPGTHSIKSVLIYSLLIYEDILKERINLLGKKYISDIVSDETVEVPGVAPAMFEK